MDISWRSNFLPFLFAVFVRVQFSYCLPSIQASWNGGAGGGGVAAPCPRRGGGGQKVPFKKQIVLPFAHYKLAYNILTAVETVLLTNSSPVYCILVFSQEFKITNFWGGGGIWPHAMCWMPLPKSLPPYPQDVPACLPSFFHKKGTWKIHNIIRINNYLISFKCLFGSSRRSE